MIELEEVRNCPVCKATGPWKPVVESEDFETRTGKYSIVACPSCDMQFTSPRPTEASIPALYDTRSTPDFAPQANASLTQRLRNGVIDRYLAHSLGDRKGTVRVLDFGCGDGALTVGVRRWTQRTGVATFTTAIDFHSEAPPALAVADAPWEYLDFWTWRDRQAQYDVVFLRHVLEHHTHPAELLEQLKAALVPGGTLNIEVPNRNSVWSSVFGKYFFALYLPRHMMHFDIASLTRVVTSAGLQVEEVRKAHTPGMGRSIGQWLGMEIDNLGVLSLLLYPFQVCVDVLCGRSTTLRVKARR